MTDPFPPLLNETVTAPRLSGTKVKTLTDQFVSSLDVSHITTFFKLNRSLPPAGQARISSLYVFDALARGAHKESVKGKKRQEAKRCLDALEAVAESWVEGMTVGQGGASWTEGKDKAKKIIDIWRKYEIFPSETMDRLSQRLVSTPLASGSRSTTPTYEPGTRPGTNIAGPAGPPPISPALPPLEMGGDVPAVNLARGASAGGGSGSGSGKSGEGPSSSPALPPDILKLLGLSSNPASAQTNHPNANGQTPPPAPTNTGQAELAAILARLPGANANVQSPNPSAPPPSVPAGGIALGGLTINPAQLAELARVANKIKSPPGNNHPQLPYPPFGGLGGFSQPPPPPTLPIPQGQYPPPPVGQGQGGGPQMPPGTSRNYGKVKPLKNPLVGLPGSGGAGPGAGAFSPPPIGGGGGYGHNPSASGSGSGQWQHPDRRQYDNGPTNLNSNSNGYGGDDRDRDRGGRNGWSNHRDRERERERSRSPPRRQDRDRPSTYERERPPLPAPPPATAIDSGWSSRRAPAPVPPQAQAPTLGGGGGGPTLENFDMASFNPMDPGSWASLGQAWKASKGTEPSQMDLMGWMMGGGAGAGAGGQGGGGFGQGQGMATGPSGGGGGWGQGGY